MLISLRVVINFTKKVIKMKSEYFYLFCLLIINLVSGKQKLPSYIKICRRSDPNLKECIKESIDLLKPLLAKGIPDFDIPSCEPLVIPEVVIDQGSGPVAVKSTYRNIKVYGPSNFIIKNVKVDMNKNKVKLKIWLPQLLVNTNYSMDGRILMMPITGTGISRGNYTDIDATIALEGQKIKKNNETYFNIKDFFVNFNIKRASLQFEDLFNGDKELGDAMNLFLNDNWKKVAEEIKPVLEDTIASIFKKIANKIFHKYALDVLMPK